MSDCKLFYRLLIIRCPQKRDSSVRRAWVLCFFEGLKFSLIGCVLTHRAGTQPSFMYDRRSDGFF